MVQAQYDPHSPDDLELEASIREINQQRTAKLVAVVVGLCAALGASAIAVYLAYSDKSDTIKEIEATQPAAP